MKHHPVTQNGKPDLRYTIEKEFCGQDGPRYVARFCGDWIGQSQFYGSALMLCIGKSAENRGCAVIVGKPA